MTLNGPDQIIEAETFVATTPESKVKLRTGISKPDDFKPISLPSLLRKAASKGPDHLALAVKRDDKWLKWTYRDYLEETEAVAKALIALGLEPRHGVGIIGFNSPEWFIADLASVFAGGMAAGIYPTNSADACRYIMENCKANVLVVEDDKQLAKFLPFRDQLPHLKAIVQYVGESKTDGVISWKDLVAKGKSLPDDDLNARLKAMAINECCHLVYTSGTTGPPKGVMLSHDNLTFTAQRLCDIFEMRDKQERIVSYLPLSHVAANICDIFVMMTSIGSVYFADKNALKGTLTDSLKDALPTLFFGVPRVWEKIHEKMLEVGRRNKGLKQQIGQWAKRTGLEHNRNRLNATSGGEPSSIKYKIANKVVFQKVKSALGLNKCLRFYSAAAPTSMEVLEYFMSLDIRVLEIYGMSECSGPHLSNTYKAQKLGTIGKELPGFYNRIDEGGELLAKGRHVMMGYLGQPEKTASVLDEEGWLRSGDIAKIDSDGYVSITGRIKELIITAGGENVPPVLIEDAIKRELPCVSNAMIVGDRKKFLSCLLTLKVDVDPDTLEPQPTLAPACAEWAASVSKATPKTVDEAIADDAVKKAIQAGINEANSKMARFAGRFFGAGRRIGTHAQGQATCRTRKESGQSR